MERLQQFNPLGLALGFGSKNIVRANVIPQFLTGGGKTICNLGDSGCSIPNSFLVLVRLGCRHISYKMEISGRAVLGGNIDWRYLRLPR